MTRSSAWSKMLPCISILVVGLLLDKAVFARPPQINQDFDAVDACILNCDSCFKGDALVNCANKCITQDGIVGPVWIHACRHFAAAFPPNYAGNKRNGNYA